jgi:hypothetical protein
MRTVKIGSKEYRQCQTPFDIGDERFLIFKQMFLQVFENLDKASFAQAFARYASYFNSGNHADGLIEWHNFKKSVELRDLNYDAYSFCFALITMTADESQSDFASDIQLKKLAEMRENGLSRGQVEDDVRNFIKAFPETFGVYLEVLEMMKAPAMEES